MQIEKFIGESKIKGQPKKRFIFNINDKSVTPNKLAESVKTEVIQPMIDASFADLQNQIDSIQVGGLALSQKFGHNPHIGVSQNALTNMFELVLGLLFKKLLNKCFYCDVDVAYSDEEISITLTVDLDINVDTIEIYNSSNIKIGQMIGGGHYYSCSYSTTVPDSGTMDFTAVITINNIPEYLTLSIPIMNSRYNAYIGGGVTYEDVMIEANSTLNYGPTSSGNSRVYNFTTEDGDYMWFIFPKSYTISGMTSDSLGVPFTQVTVEDAELDAEYNFYRSSTRVNAESHEITVIFN